VRLTKPGMKGVQVKYRIGKQTAPTRVDRCLSAVTGKPVDC
jgi:hypothetical protein